MLQWQWQRQRPHFLEVAGRGSPLHQTALEEEEEEEEKITRVATATAADEVASDDGDAAAADVDDDIEDDDDDEEDEEDEDGRMACGRKGIFVLLTVLLRHSRYLLERNAPCRVQWNGMAMYGTVAPHATRVRWHSPVPFCLWLPGEVAAPIGGLEREEGETTHVNFCIPWQRSPPRAHWAWKAYH